ncbi:MAG TPA: thiamine phosphate synthase [Rhizomicrobium sp.]|nr:thiamine phosphate synthase [Rhizomicrobium sp.]
MSDSLARARLARAAGRLAGGALPPLVLMTDAERLADPASAARALPRGSMVVARARDSERLRLLARTLLDVSRARGLAILLAGDPELAARLGAGGAHLPESRAGEAAYWRARFPALTITCAAHSLRALMRAALLPVDAVLLSPVFASASHPGRAPLSAARASLIARSLPPAVYALGGIDARSVLRLAPGAFAGVAAVGALRA